MYNHLIPKVLGWQIVVLLISTVAIAFINSSASLSFLMAGVSITIPSFFLALNIVFARFSTFFFWIGVLFNKVLMIMLLWVSIEMLEKPSYGAFLIGIIAMTHVPLIYVLWIQFTKAIR